MGEAKRRGTRAERVEQALQIKVLKIDPLGPVTDALSQKDYVMYFDETNNFRKLYLASEYSHTAYLNSESNPFVLGGMAFDPKIHNIENIKAEIDVLLRRMNKQPTQTEFKFKHVATGKLPDVLKSAKLKSFFKWMIENKVFMHTKVLDVIYFSIVDILESETAFKIYYSRFEPRSEDQCHSMPLIKVALSEMIRLYRKEFFEMAFRIGYPDINSGNKQEFINELIQLCERYIGDACIDRLQIQVDLTNMLIDVFKAFRSESSDGFVFLEGESKSQLIDQMNQYYKIRIDTFPKAQQYYDNEEEVAAVINKHWKMRPNKNYEFLDSDSDIMVQLSDVLIGFVRVFHEFLLETPFNQIENIINDMTAHQKECLGYYFDIENYSNQECMYFLNYIGPISTNDKVLKIKSLL